MQAHIAVFLPPSYCPHGCSQQVYLQIYTHALNEVHLALLNSMRFLRAHFSILSAPLNGIPSFFCGSLVSFAILLMQHPILVYAVVEDIKGCRFQNALRDTTCHQPPPGHRPRPQTDPSTQPIPCSSNCLPFKCISLQTMTCGTLLKASQNSRQITLVSLPLLTVAITPL